MIDWWTAEWTANVFRLVGLLGGAVAATIALALWFARTALVSKEELRRQREIYDQIHEAIEQRLSEGEIKFAALHADLSRLPDQRDVMALTGRVSAVEGSVQALSASIEGVGAALGRLERQLDMLIGFHLKEKS
jgi:hypothetical protein